MTETPTRLEIPLGRILSVAPRLPTTDVARAVEHYGRLGFTAAVRAPGQTGAATVAVVQRDGVELHLVLEDDRDRGRTVASVHFRVEDADEIAAELAAAGVQPDRPPHDTVDDTREVAYVDPDGNLLRFASRLTSTRGAVPDAAATGVVADVPAVPAVVPPVVPPDVPPDVPSDVPSDGERRTAFEFARALRRGDLERVTALLADDPGLATALINSCRALHLYADAPGHRPHPRAIVHALVGAGADVDAHAVGTWHHETALHWAASNDDVELIDVLLDAGADIEHPGSSIDGGPPAQSALGYAQWNALRRLHEGGAKIGLSHAAALGLMPDVVALTASVPPKSAEELSLALWNACRAGQLEAARLLLERGADLYWQAPWSGQTPLDAAREQHHVDVVNWLLESGATPSD